MAQFLGREPTPEDAAQFAEDYEQLLSRLDDETPRTIALRKLDGHTTESIAAELGTSARTVDRKLEPHPEDLGGDTGMNASATADDGDLSLDDWRRVDTACDQFEAAWRARGSAGPGCPCWPSFTSRRGRGCSASS